MLQEQVLSLFQIRHGSWNELQSAAKFIRTEVFIQEQKIAAEDEWDQDDKHAVHFILYDQTRAIATARLLPNHWIGRVAVLKTDRGRGLGKALMQAIIKYAQEQQLDQLCLSSQVHATSFYQELGFACFGEVYEDCGIPHINMHLTLSSTMS